MEDQLNLKIYRLFDGKISVAAFEAWIYENDERLEKELAENFYLELISFHYNSKYAKQTFFATFEAHIDWADYELRRMNALLDSIIQRDEHFAENLMHTYDLRCAGYWFLEELGMNYALNLMSSFEYGMSNWDAVPKEEKDQYIEQNYEGAKAAALQVQGWLTNKKIVLTGERGGAYNQYVYTDHRLQEELSEAERNYAMAIAKDKDDVVKKQRRPWWQFWRG